jgi:hypothetical protein
LQCAKIFREKGFSELVKKLAGAAFRIGLVRKGTS